MARFFLIRDGLDLLRSFPIIRFQRSIVAGGEGTQNLSQTEESKSEFRVLIPQGKTGIQERKSRPRRNAVSRYKSMHIDQDWTSVWPTRAMFKASAVPLPLRQGMVTCMLENGGIVPAKYANAELMKVPNFLHLTPRHIHKQCEVIKVLCTKFPDELKDPKVQRQYLPLEVTTRDYVYSSCDIRDERARVVQFEVREKWESTKHYTDWEGYVWDKSPAKAKLASMMTKLQRPPSDKEKLEEEYKQVFSALHDKKTELEDDLIRYREVVEKLYRLNSVKAN